MKGRWMTRGYLAVVGLAYWALAVWCAVLPETTSASVGFDLRPGSGQSEYLTVYGGLEFGLGLVFLAPLWRPEMTRFSLLTCLAIHASLVAFRSASFLLYANIPSMTYGLAAGEWVILLSSAALAARRAARRSPGNERRTDDR
jgi:hypothetical protein